MLITSHKRLPPWVIFAALGCLLALPEIAQAQGTSGPTVSDSQVGYIDSAIPGNIFRLRYDDAYNARRPTRAEFIYARTAPQGPGLPLPEPSIDFQEATAYLEKQISPCFSAFVELPTRFLNPDVNANAAGFGDMNAGFKYVFWQGETGLATFQFRTYIPTGDAERGLGTHHVSLEPSLLFYRAVGDKAAIEGELRYWVPVGGTEFAGDILRYGIGFRYEVFNNGYLRINPVTELVTWTVLSGQESFVFPSGLPAVQGAAGDTIVNVKVGVRFAWENWADVYAGYGRPLTGDRWYENIFRVEFRLHY